MYDKVVSLGSRLRYPITITKLLKTPGDTIRKQEHIIEYKFTWRRKINDEEWDDETTYTEFDSPAEGKLKEWRLEEGMVISADMPCMTVEEACGHEVQMQGLCSLCGADMTEINWASEERDVDRANINMVHDQTNLMVSQGVAQRVEHEAQSRLLRARKLSLVVDLDQTIIHACVDNTVGEWQRDPTNPNHKSVNDIKSFQLQEDANGFTYYIKQRPGLSEFLEEISKIYELHVYTMGTRAYALSVANIVDPDKRYFGNRVISRDENGSLTAKSLQRLFPVSTDMVVIIDDRSDVWPYNRPNLIKVVPYDFYKGIGDINSSFLPKRKDVPLLPMQPNGSVTKTADSAPQIKLASTSEPAENATEDEANLQVQVEEQEKTLEKQSADRPLLHLQEELDKEDEQVPESEIGESSPGHGRQTLLNDDDEELIALQDHLTDLHSAFYQNYDRKRRERKQIEPQVLPGQVKPRKKSTDDGIDLSMVPDVGEILEELKSDVLSGLVVVLSGLVPLGTRVEESEIGVQAQSLGAQVFDTIGPRVTHLIVSLERPRTKKVQQAARIPSIRIVNQNWLIDCLSQWRRLNEGPYLIDVPDGDRLRVEQDVGEPTSGDETTTDSAMGNGLDKFDWDKADEELEEFLEDVSSGDEDGSILEEEEIEFDEDTNSSQKLDDEKTTSSNDQDDTTMTDTDQPAKTLKRKSRPEEEPTNPELLTVPNESALAKKQRVARSRGASSLRSVTMGDELDDQDEGSALPTPGPTGDEGTEADEDPARRLAGEEAATNVDQGQDFDDDELARELEAELEAQMG